MDTLDHILDKYTIDPPYGNHLAHIKQEKVQEFMAALITIGFTIKESISHRRYEVLLIQPNSLTDGMVFFKSKNHPGFWVFNTYLLRHIYNLL